MRRAGKLGRWLLKYIWQSLVQYGLAAVFVPNVEDYELCQPVGQIGRAPDDFPEAGFLDDTTLYAWLYGTLDANPGAPAPAEHPAPTD